MPCALLRLIACLAAPILLLAPAGPTAAAACTNADIAAVIDGAGAALRKLNATHQPALQAKLRRLADERHWSEAEREARTAEFLQDAETRRLNEQASQLLTELDVLGDETASEGRSCVARLERLKTVSAQLIEVTTAKASHVTARLDAALAPQRAAAPQTAGKQEQKTAATPAPATPPAGALTRAPPAARSWEADTVRNAAPGEAGQPSAPAATAGLPPRLPEAEDLEFTAEDIRAAGRGFFGSISAGLASVIEYAFNQYGRPNGYILGSEGGAALLAGLRYGDGRLVTKSGGEEKVYWQGPSVGYDVGLAGSRVMFLVYNLREHDELFARFVGVDGSAYLVGGVGVTFLKKGRVVLAPIRTGLGLRIGANLGYLKFTPKPSLNPF
ncbi:MAG: DUF1134 domain-containing protein [Hyphomicrobiaceae bacterium]|nr:DUF1134 domain-containing protein [Hyphomicrobiaceae bacterium]